MTATIIFFKKGGFLVKKRVRNNQGFTLVEIMMVVIIIGILAVLAIPRYEKYTIESKLAEVAIATGEIKTGMEKYFNSHGNKYRDITPDAGNSWLERILRIDLGGQENFMFAVSRHTRGTRIGFLVRAVLTTGGQTNAYASSDVGDEVVYYFPRELNTLFNDDIWKKGWNDDDFFMSGQSTGKYPGD